jgi:DNA-binding winged helix-turn-helix (wHTH) protein/tetratricopeptide (TPR) repeat protein
MADSGDAKAIEEPKKHPIILAKEPSFRLGPLLIDPRQRRVQHDDDRSEFIEPRVMQVLVALVRANGEFLSRDDLAFSCWERRIVGDDAINRTLSRLRRVAEGIGAGSFRVETLTKVGYRLAAEAGTSPPPRPGAASAPGSAADSRGRDMAVAAVILAIVGIAAVWSWQSTPATVTVSVAGTRPQSAGLARDLRVDLTQLSEAHPENLSILAGAQGRADYVVGVNSKSEGEHSSEDVSLRKSGGPTLLWTARLERSGNDPRLLREQMSAKVGAVLLCVARQRAASSGFYDVTMRLFLAACDELDEPVGEPRRELIDHLAQQVPQFGWAQAKLAMVEGDMADATPVDQGAEFRISAENLRRSARMHSRKAREIDPSVGETYSAEGALIPASDWRARLEFAERGIAADPSYSRLHSDRASALAMVGRSMEAVTSQRRAVQLDPLSAKAQSRLVNYLAYAGNFEGARRELARLERIWPESAALRNSRYRIALRYGDPREALAILDQDETTGEDGQRPVWFGQRAFMQARMNPSSANIEAALRHLRETYQRRRLVLTFYLQELGTFGKLEEAYAVTEGADSDLSEVREGSEVLFRPELRAFRHDRRFMHFTKRIGLLKFWRSTNRWPDFCDDPDLPYNCKDEANRLLAD